MIKIFSMLVLLAVPAGAAQVYYDPRDYGATFQGGHDDSAGWQGAVDAAVAGRGRVLAPCGASYVRSPIVIHDPLVLEGSGAECTVLVNYVPAGQPAILVSGRFGVAIRDIGVICPEPGRVGIRVTAPVATIGTGNHGSEVGRVRISGCSVGVDFANAMVWSLHDGTIGSPGRASIGVRISNEVTDAGDADIYAMVIVSGKPAPPGSVAIQHLQSGGLKITSSKILGWAAGYQLVQQGGQMSDLLITNTSFETITGPAVGFSRKLGLFHNVVITGNQFAHVGGCVRQMTPGTWLGDVVVVANRCDSTVTFSGAQRVTAAFNK